MDFARAHVCEASVATKSNIRYIPPRELKDGETKTLDDMVIEAANQAAQELLLGPSTTAAPHNINNNNNNNNNNNINNDGQNWNKDLESTTTTSSCDTRWIDARFYPDRISPQSDVIQPHQLVVIFESFDHLSFVYATPHAIFSNRNGHFHHDDFIGKPFGCKIRSRNQRGYGFMYLLKPTPELWSRSLPHRTQIIHELDASMIVYYLNLRPNMIVCESGTGSGALSHFLLRTIAPRGHLHTYDFNQHRVGTAREEFAKHGLEQLVTVHYKDVCGKQTTTAATATESYQFDDSANTASSGGGFDLPGQSVDAIVLDLPNPWLAVPYAAYVLKPACRIVTYSPCVEQSQRTILALKKAGFHSITTQEFRRKEYYVDEVDIEGPPTEKRPRTETHNILAYANNHDNDNNNNNVNTNQANSSNNSTIYYGDVDTGAEADNEESQASECEVSLATEDTALGSEERLAMMAPPNLAGAVQPSVALASIGTSGTNATTPTATTAAASAITTTTAPLPPHKALPSSQQHQQQQQAQQQPPPPRKRVLVARPFVSMRGHTAFLTFATAGNKRQPYPNHNINNQQHSQLHTKGIPEPSPESAP